MLGDGERMPTRSCREPGAESPAPYRLTLPCRATLFSRDSRNRDIASAVIDLMEGEAVLSVSWESNGTAWLELPNGDEALVSGLFGCDIVSAAEWAEAQQSEAA